MSGLRAIFSGTPKDRHQRLLCSGTFRSSRLRRRLLLDENLASFSARGFQCTSNRAHSHLELIGRTFIRGYNVAVECQSLDGVTSALNEVGAELRGFAFEGASMATSLLDALCIAPSRFAKLVQGQGHKYKHLCWVGSGWTCARLGLLHWRLRCKLFSIDPLLSMLAYDGWGFHEGYFFSSRYLNSCGTPPAQLRGQRRRVFDQGFGRSLWFVSGADPLVLAGLISRYSLERQEDMWSGVGLACAYAGGTDRHGIDLLLSINPAILPHLRQGVVFGATARVHSGNVTEDTVLAARRLCGSTPELLAARADAIQAQSKGYHEWRRDIQQDFV